MDQSLVAPAEGPSLHEQPVSCYEKIAQCCRRMRGAAASAASNLEMVSAMTGVTAFSGMLGPTQMMLMKPDKKGVLQDSHLRWFRIDADNATIEWSKNAEGGVLVLPTKGPFSIISVREGPGGYLELHTSCASAGGSGETVRFKPNQQADMTGGSEYKTWLDCCTGLVAKNKGRDLKGAVKATVKTYTGCKGPTPMMFCKPKDLKSKHVRKIRVNCDECTVEWGEIWVGEGAEAFRKAGKGPFRLLGVKEVQRASMTDEFNQILELTTDGLSAYVKPETEAEYSEWLDCLRSVAIRGASR